METHNACNSQRKNVGQIHASQEVCLVIGSTHGIGKALAEELLQNGRRVIGCASSAEDSRGAELERRWRRYQHHICDISSELDVKRLYTEIAQSGVKIRTIFNCAGIGFKPRASSDFRAAEGRRVLEVNTLGVSILLKYGIPLLDKEHGAFVVCGSVAADQAGTGADAMYGASKAALRPLLREVAAEPENKGISFLYCKLGYIQTRMTAADNPDSWRIHTRFGQPGTPQETAKLLLQMMTPHTPGYAEREILGGDYLPRLSAKSPPTRKAGILLSVTSLPNPYACGNLGAEAYALADTLEEAGIQVWMMLPLNPTGISNSPYSALSSLAGSINLISPALLRKEGLLSQKEHDALLSSCKETNYGECYRTRPEMIRQAYRRFQKTKNTEMSAQFRAFRAKNQDWLMDFSVYMSAKDFWLGLPWQEWPDEALRNHDAEAVSMKKHQPDVEAIAFSQFLFYRQLKALRRYANAHNVRLIGDIPFYVGPDSADVWAERELFQVDAHSGKVMEYAGIPNRNAPDTNWGNPCYNWERQRMDGFAWWRRRIRFFSEVYDALRIDHAVGLFQCYCIPADGTPSGWKPGPDTDGAFSQMIANEAERAGTDIIMEDLGEVPSGLRKRIHELGFCGTRILQYAYSTKYFAHSSHLPMYQTENTMCLTGTHDNQPLSDFLMEKKEAELGYMKYMLNVASVGDLHWAMIRAAYSSPARYAVIPVQDILELGKESCMINRQHFERSWLWRMDGFAELRGLCPRLRAMAILNGRMDASEMDSVEALALLTKGV